MLWKKENGLNSAKTYWRHGGVRKFIMLHDIAHEKSNEARKACSSYILFYHNIVSLLLCDSNQKSPSYIPGNLTTELWLLR